MAYTPSPLDQVDIDQAMVDEPPMSARQKVGIFTLRDIFNIKIRADKPLFFLQLGKIIILLLLTSSLFAPVLDEEAFPLLKLIFILGILLPLLVAFARNIICRLRDCNLSGLTFFLLLIPFVGFFLFVYLMVKSGSPGNNCYGSPRELHFNLTPAAEIFSHTVKYAMYFILVTSLLLTSWHFATGEINQTEFFAFFE